MLSDGLFCSADAATPATVEREAELILDPVQDLRGQQRDGREAGREHEQVRDLLALRDLALLTGLVATLGSCFLGTFGRRHRAPARREWLA
jgi:hypothetical protein